MGEPGVIQKLDDVVVNRIAAGEVIQRPANALKELLENSLDAKSTNILVTLKNGGLKLLQIQDNGTGIRKEDLPIVCERFTTSKLTKFEDLTTISTFGFRGEALASISHVAHLTIVTKTSNNQCAYKAQYVDGRLKGPIVPCASNQGTQITVEDLFYNVPMRSKVLKNSTEEFAKVANVVGKYAVHNPSVGFVLKRQGETISDIKTNALSSHVDNIRAVYGDSIAKEVFEIEHTDDVLKFKMHGFITNVNYSTKKQVFILFINNRLVDSTALKKAVEQEYSIHLPSGGHPFVYLSLTLEPKNVDVNVHPTKHEVHFLHEEEIIDSARKAVETKLLGSNRSRVFYTQAKLPSTSMNIEAEEALLQKFNSSEPKVRDNNLVRTDSTVQKIEKFFSAHYEDAKSEVSDKIIRRDIKLTSVLSLRRDVAMECSLALRDIISDSIYVGLAEREDILVQHNTTLYMLHLETLKEELFYQFMVFDFGNFAAIKFQNPLPLSSLVEIGLNDPDFDFSKIGRSKEEIKEDVIKTLCSKKEMLVDYFSMEINDSDLCTIPLLLKNYVPDMSRLPCYLLRLACDVNWKKEEPCFRGVCRETARFYSFCSHSDEIDKYKWNVEHVLYPAIKKHLKPPKKLANDKSITNLIGLPTLYRVFERC